MSTAVETKTQPTQVYSPDQTFISSTNEMSMNSRGYGLIEDFNRGKEALLASLPEEGMPTTISVKVTGPTALKFATFIGKVEDFNTALEAFKEAVGGMPTEAGALALRDRMAAIKDYFDGDKLGEAFSKLKEAFDRVEQDPYLQDHKAKSKLLQKTVDPMAELLSGTVTEQIDLLKANYAEAKDNVVKNHLPLPAIDLADYLNNGQQFVTPSFINPAVPVAAAPIEAPAQVEVPASAPTPVESTDTKVATPEHSDVIPVFDPAATPADAEDSAVRLVPRPEATPADVTLSPRSLDSEAAPAEVLNPAVPTSAPAPTSTPSSVQLTHNELDSVAVRIRHNMSVDYNVEIDSIAKVQAKLDNVETRLARSFFQRLNGFHVWDAATWIFGSPGLSKQQVKLQAELSERKQAYRTEERLAVRQELGGHEFGRSARAPRMIVEAAIPSDKRGKLLSTDELRFAVNERLDPISKTSVVSSATSEGFTIEHENGSKLEFRPLRGGKVDIYQTSESGIGARVGSAWTDDALKIAKKFIDSGVVSAKSRPKSSVYYIPTVEEAAALEGPGPFARP